MVKTKAYAVHDGAADQFKMVTFKLGQTVRLCGNKEWAGVVEKLGTTYIHVKSAMTGDVLKFIAYDLETVDA